MRGETIPKHNDFTSLKRLSERIRPGQAPQDLFLKTLLSRMILSYPDAPHQFPNADTNRLYGGCGNYRLIYDENSNDRIGYAYFDFPVRESPLYIATNDSSLITTIPEEIKNNRMLRTRIADYKHTLLSNPWATIMISLTARDHRTDPFEHPSTLQHTTDYARIRSIGELFDVKDTSTFYSTLERQIRIQDRSETTFSQPQWKQLVRINQPYKN